MGGNGIWTTAYKVYYSVTGDRWNPIIEEVNGTEKIFLANVDDHSTKINYFVKPLRTRYLKIVPIKWHLHIGLKVEIYGQFVIYSKYNA